MTDLVPWGFALVALLAFTVQTAVGFASTLICVTLGAHLMPIRHVVALAVVLSFVQTAYVVVRHRDGVQWKLLWLRILPLMGIGALLGYLVVREVAAAWVEHAFAAMVTALSARELHRLVREPGRRAPLSRLASSAIVFAAGVVHGAYATGGPPLVYAVGRELEKRELRSTLSVVWLVMDGALAASFALDGFYTPANLEPLLLVPIALPLGVVLGELVHRKVPEHRFKQALFALLFFAALSLFFR